MIRNVRDVRPGPATTLFDGLLPLLKGTIVHFRSGRGRPRDVSITTVETLVKNPPGKRRTQGYVIEILSHQTRAKQAILSVRNQIDMTPSLVWAGDLDQDGATDFLVDVELGEAHGSTFHLYLSSHAKAGEIVGLAARLRFPAC